MPENEKWQDEEISLGGTLALKSINEADAPALYELVMRNKAWLQKAMDWPQYVTSEEDIRKTAQGNYLLHHHGGAKMFLIFQHEEPIGVFSFNAIEKTNKTAYIGYWLDEKLQGQRIISKAIDAVLAKYSKEGSLRRFVIKCIVSNESSNRVAQRNGFILEGCLRQAEYLNGKFYDQNIYARIVD